MGKCTPPSYKSVTPSKSPGCTMKSHSRWVLLWFEEIFLHHRILSSYSKLSTQWRPPDHNLKTRTRVGTLKSTKLCMGPEPIGQAWGLQCLAAFSEGHTFPFPCLSVKTKMRHAIDKYEMQLTE